MSSVRGTIETMLEEGMRSNKLRIMITEEWESEAPARLIALN